MGDNGFGSADFLVVRFEEETPPAGVGEALRAAASQGAVRVLDLLLVSRTAAGSLRVREWEEAETSESLHEIELHASGIAGTEDVTDIQGLVAPGTTVAIAVLENRWVAELESRLAQVGADVVLAERIPAAALSDLVAGHGGAGEKKGSSCP